VALTESPLVLCRCDELAEKDRKRYEREKAERAAQLQRQEREEAALRKTLQEAAVAALSPRVGDMQPETDALEDPVHAQAAAQLRQRATAAVIAAAARHQQQQQRYHHESSGAAHVTRRSKKRSVVHSSASSGSSSPTPGGEHANQSIASSAPLYGLVQYLNQPLSPIATPTHTAHAGDSTSRGTTPSPNVLPPALSLPPVANATAYIPSHLTSAATLSPIATNPAVIAAMAASMQQQNAASGGAYSTTSTAAASSALLASAFQSVSRAAAAHHAHELRRRRRASNAASSASSRSRSGSIGASDDEDHEMTDAWKKSGSIMTPYLPLGFRARKLWTDLFNARVFLRLQRPKFSCANARP